MIITKNDHFHNTTKICSVAEPRLKPEKREGLYIQSQLKSIGFSYRRVGSLVSVSGEFVLNVTTGRRRSRRVEAEIARVLGKASWNEVVAEARLAVSGNYTPSAKDVSKFLEQTYRQYQKRLVELEEHHKQMAKKLEPTRAAIAARKWKR